MTRSLADSRSKAQVADAIDRALEPRGVAVVIEAEHQCMSARGVRKTGALTVTRSALGTFKHDQALRCEFFESIR